MVLKNIQRIKSALPEVFHVAMFYNTGTIFQTTFEQNINIPKLGENLAELLTHVQKVYEICNFKMENYRKFIFETDDISTIIIKLGEDSNLALFFKKEEDHDLKLHSIKRYINRIEHLIDMDKIEIMIQELGLKEEEFKNIQNSLAAKRKQIEDLEKQYTKNLLEEESKKLSKEMETLERECEELKIIIELKKREIDSIKEKIEQERNIS